MSIRKKFLLSFLKVLIFSILVVSCSADDDSGAIAEKTSFVTDPNPTSAIENDGIGKVTLTVTGKWSDGTLLSIGRGYVYGTTPNLKVESGSTTEELDSNGQAVIKGLEQNTTYYIRGFIKKEDNTYFYGNEIKVTTPKWGTERAIKMIVIEPLSIAIDARRAYLSLKVEEITGVPPIEVGVEYSNSNNFSESVFVKSDTDKITAKQYNVDVFKLNPSTKYYVRPYVKYSDDTVDNGGDSTIAIDTEKLSLGDNFPLLLSEFANDGRTSRFVVLEVDENARTAKVVLKKDIIADEGWKMNYVVDGLEVRNPTRAELNLVKSIRGSVISGADDIPLYIFKERTDGLNNIGYWTSEEDGAGKAVAYNPITETTTSIDKTDVTHKTRYIADIKY